MQMGHRQRRLARFTPPSLLPPKQRIDFCEHRHRSVIEGEYDGGVDAHAEHNEAVGEGVGCVLPLSGEW